MSNLGLCHFYNLSQCRVCHWNVSLEYHQTECQPLQIGDTVQSSWKRGSAKLSILPNVSCFYNVESFLVSFLVCGWIFHLQIFSLHCHSRYEQPVGAVQKDGNKNTKTKEKRKIQNWRNRKLTLPSKVWVASACSQHSRQPGGDLPAQNTGTHEKLVKSTEYWNI